MADYHKKIRDILKEYEKNRGFFGRLFGFFGVPGFGRHPFIKMLRKFNFKPNAKNKPEKFQILQGIIENKSGFLWGNVEDAYIATLHALLPRSKMPLDNLKEFLGILHRNNLLSEENINNIEARDNYSSTYITVYNAALLRLLDKAKLVNQVNFDVAITHAKPGLMASILAKLDDAGLLNSENFAAIKAHADLYPMDLALTQLAYAKCLNSENFDAIKMCTGDNFMNEFRSKFKPVENLDRLLDTHKLYLNDPEFAEDIGRVPSHLHNDPAVFEKLVECAEGRKRAAQMQAEVDPLFARQGQGSHSSEFFNPETSAANSFAPSQAAHSSSSLSP